MVNLDVREVAEAKRRVRARMRSRGAVAFIVSMSLAALAFIGLYALSVSSTEIRTAGHERQNAQTYYLTEFGAIGAAQEVTAAKTDAYLGLMMLQPDTPCFSLPNMTSTASLTSRACRRWATSAEMKASGAWSNAALVAPSTPATATPGSLGPYPLGGDFSVELTEPAQAPAPPGFDLRLGLCFVQVTVTSMGITQANVSDATSKAGSMGLLTGRARIIAGPTRQCPGQN